jgi:hypothetical protein
VPTVTGPSPPTYINTNYQFSAVSTDPNGDTIRYRFQWGDGTPDTYTGYYASGQTAYASHAWTSAGTFQMYVSAEDSTGRTNYPRPVTVNIQSPSISYNVAFEINVDGQYVGMPFQIDGLSGYYGGHSYSLGQGTHTISFSPQFYYFMYMGAIWYHDETYDVIYYTTFGINVDEEGQAVIAYYHHFS